MSIFKIRIIISVLLICTLNSCKIYKELENGNIIAPDSTEYVFLANESFIITFGDCNFLGKVKGEFPRLLHMFSFSKTGMYSCDDKNLDILYRIKPDSEWGSYYQKASLSKIELIPENCIRFEFIYHENIKWFKNNFSPEKIHMNCNEGISDPDDLQTFLYVIKNEEIWLRKRGRSIGYIYGYFENELNYAIPYHVWSSNNSDYIIDTNTGSFVIPIELMEKLGYKK